MTLTATATPRTAPAPLRARQLLSGVFAILGALMAVWGARMPAVQAAAHLGPGRLAVVLLAAAAGMVVGLQIGGRLADRHGPARLLAAPAAIFGVALAVLGQCHTLTALIPVAVVFGVGHGLLDVGANTAAVYLERAYQRPIMASLHCAYSCRVSDFAAQSHAPLHIGCTYEAAVRQAGRRVHSFGLLGSKLGRLLSTAGSLVVRTMVWVRVRRGHCCGSRGQSAPP